MIMNTYIHENFWIWGRQDAIVIADGAAFCFLSVEDDNPAVAHLSNVSVHELDRRKGYGDELLNLAKDHAREMGAKMLALWVDPNIWMFEWYKRRGFKHVMTYDDGMAGMTFDLE